MGPSFYWPLLLAFLLRGAPVVVSFRRGPGPGALLRPADVGAQPRVPGGLVLTQRRVLQGPDNHQLGEREFSAAPRLAIPFDKIHFQYTDEDWAIYDVTGDDVGSDDVRPGEDVTGSKMIVSVSPDVHKELAIRTVVKAASHIRIGYQVHMLARDPEVRPSFSVYLISNGTKTLLREEDPQEVWSSSHIEVDADGESELVFVGVLNGEGSQIALRSFILQDLSSPPGPKRYGVTSLSRETPNSEHILFGNGPGRGPKGLGGSPQLRQVETMKFNVAVEGKELLETEGPTVASSPPFQNSNLVLTTTVKTINESSSSSYSDFKSSQKYSGQPRYGSKGKNYAFDRGAAPYLTYPNGSIHDRARSSAVDPSNYYPTTPFAPYTTTTPLKQSLSDNGTYLDAIYNLSNTTFNSTETYASNETVYTSSSRVRGVIFIVGMVICALAVIAYLGWRRRRSATEDDEIPVFSRAASEHGNPTFTDRHSSAFADEDATFDVGLNTETPANYRSFR